MDNVKSAVSIGLLKKRKKAKPSRSPEADKEKVVDEKGKGKEGTKSEAKSSASTLPVVDDNPPVAAIPLDAVGA